MNTNALFGPRQSSVFTVREQFFRCQRSTRPRRSVGASTLSRRQYGLRIEKQLKGGDGIYVVSVPTGASSAAVLQALKSNPQVLNAEPNQKRDR